MVRPRETYQEDSSKNFEKIRASHKTYVPERKLIIEEDMEEAKQKFGTNALKNTPMSDVDQKSGKNGQRSSHTTKHKRLSHSFATPGYKNDIDEKAQILTASNECKSTMSFSSIAR